MPPTMYGKATIRVVLLFVIGMSALFIYFGQEMPFPNRIHVAQQLGVKPQTRDATKTPMRSSTVQYYHKRLLGCSSLDPKVIDSYKKQIKDTFSEENAKISFLPTHKNPCWIQKDMPNSSAANSTGKLRCLPYVYLAGFAKSGTTDLYKRFIQHPLVAPPIKKELDWWSWKAMGYLTRRLITYDEYVGYFEAASSMIEATTIGSYHPLITVDGSVSTLWELDVWPLIPGNEKSWEPISSAVHLIHKFTPDAKFVVIMRNPADRLFSHYMFQKGPPGAPLEPKSSNDFHQRVIHAMTIFHKCFAERGVKECIYDTCLNHLSNTTSEKIDIYPVTSLLWNKLTIRAGMYRVFLEDLLAVFPRKQIKVVRFEDYAVDTVSTLNEIYTFLGIDELPRFLTTEVANDTVKNQRRRLTLGLGDMWTETRTILDKFYAPFNKQLADLLQDTRFTWHDN